VLALLIVKALIWSLSLGSGTSGGVLAPLLIMGGALGTLESELIPLQSPGFWAMISMAAMIGATMRTPLTAVVFTLELTTAVPALLPLLIACGTAFAVTVLLMRRSILTEKVARRGHHVMREFVVDPFKTRRVAEIMRPLVAELAADAPVREALSLLSLDRDDGASEYQAFPVVDGDGAVVGTITRARLAEIAASDPAASRKVGDLVRGTPVIGAPDDLVGALADQLVSSGAECASIVDPSGTLVGVVTRRDLLDVRALHRRAELEHQRMLQAPPMRVRLLRLRANGQQKLAEQPMESAATAESEPVG